MRSFLSQQSADFQNLDNDNSGRESITAAAETVETDAGQPGREFHRATNAYSSLG